MEPDEDNGKAQQPLELLEQRLGYCFADRDLLLRALTHPSYTLAGKTTVENNQRLEFLGDAVLGMLLAEILYELLPSEREGTLTRLRSVLARGAQLQTLARELKLGAFIHMGEAEAAQGGRERASVLEDALEALIGAIYLESGLEQARRVVRGIFGDIEARLSVQVDRVNPKGQLQERLQPRLGNDCIEYRVVAEKGPDHDKRFAVEVWFKGNCQGRGDGLSKKLAEEAAARVALERMSGSEAVP